MTLSWDPPPPELPLQVTSRLRGASRGSRPREEDGDKEGRHLQELCARHSWAVRQAHMTAAVYCKPQLLRKTCHPEGVAQTSLELFPRPTCPSLPHPPCPSAASWCHATNPDLALAELSPACRIATHQLDSKYYAIMQQGRGEGAGGGGGGGGGKEATDLALAKPSPACWVEAVRPSLSYHCLRV